MFAHNIRISVFICEDEENSIEKEQKLKDIFRSMIPVDFEREKLAVAEHTASGFNEKKIKIIELTMEKEAHTNRFLKNLNKYLSDSQRQLILSQKETRLDDGLLFYLRFDKDILLDEGKLILTDAGSCVHIRMSIAAFPRNREAALMVIGKIFK